VSRVVLPPWLRRPTGGACAIGVSLSLLAVAACTGGARPSPPAAPKPVTSKPVTSNYERASGNTIPRDCGYSSPLPGRAGWSLWLFCDTAVTGARDGKIEHLILGTDTAAAGPYRPGQVPGRLSEIATPPAPLALSGDGAPQPFLPVPQGLLLPGGTLPCTGPGAYPASWITGVTRAPGTAASSNLLISYDDYCVTDNAGSLTAEGFGLVEYDPAHNLLGPTGRVFASLAGLPAQQVLGSPVIGADGYLYLFGFCAATPTAGCGAGGVFLARTLASPASWQDPLSYAYWTGAGWSPQAAAAASVLPGSAPSPLSPVTPPSPTAAASPANLVSTTAASRPLGISVGDYRAAGHGLVMVEQTSLAGSFQVWQAASPAGPWRPVRTGKVPCTKGTQGAADALCRALIGHPELSTRSQLLISYFDPGREHVEVSPYSW
jgi:hypothetical protein